MVMVMVKVIAMMMPLHVLVIVMMRVRVPAKVLKMMMVKTAMMRPCYILNRPAAVTTSISSTAVATIPLLKLYGWRSNL